MAEDDEKERLAPGIQALIDMAGHLGELKGTTKQINERMGELADGQQRLAAAAEESAERLSSMEARLALGDKDLQDKEARLRAIEQRGPDKGGGSKWTDILAAGKAYGPYIFGALVAFYAYLKSLATSAAGGGSP